MLDARHHIEKYPSVAANTGTNIRTVQHLLTRIINTLSGKIEVSGSMAAAANIGLQSSLQSHDTWQVYICPAMKFLVSCAEADNLTSSHNSSADSSVHVVRNSSITRGHKLATSSDDSDLDNSYKNTATTTSASNSARTQPIIDKEVASSVDSDTDHSVPPSSITTALASNAARTAAFLQNSAYQQWPSSDSDCDTVNSNDFSQQDSEDECDAEEANEPTDYTFIGDFIEHTTEDAREDVFAESNREADLEYSSGDANGTASIFKVFIYLLGT